jgi:hypothetical protein
MKEIRHRQQEMPLRDRKVPLLDQHGREFHLQLGVISVHVISKREVEKRLRVKWLDMTSTMHNDATDPIGESLRRQIIQIVLAN